MSPIKAVICSGTWRLYGDQAANYAETDHHRMDSPFAGVMREQDDRAARSWARKERNTEWYEGASENQVET